MWRLLKLPWRIWRCTLVLTSGAALVLLGGCGWLRQAPQSGVVAEVNGKPITAAELNETLQEQTAGAKQPIDPAQLLDLKLNLLSQLIDRDIFLQYAARAGVQVTPAEIDQQMDAARASRPQSSDDELREEIRDRIILNKLMKREVRSRVKVTSAEIDAFYQAHQSSFNFLEPEYHIQEIMVTPTPGRVTNLLNDKAKNRRQALAKIHMIEKKLKAGADFATLAEQYSEDPNTAGSGGDLGLVPASTINTQFPPDLRAAVMSLKVGQVSPVLRIGKTSKDYVLVKLVGMEPAGVRPMTDPQVRKEIRDLLTGSRMELLRTAFLVTARDQARVKNYLAEQILDGQLK